MSRSRAFAVGALFWAMGLFTFGAYGYSITRPLVMGPLPVYTTSAEAPRAAVPAPPVEHVLEMPAVKISARVQAKAAAPKPAAVEAAPAVRDLSQMRCADWRPLEQGGSSVRECN